MSYLSKNLSVLAYANNFTMWHYVTDDSFLEVLSSGYFNKAELILTKNDLIILNTRTNNSSVWVTHNDGKTVKVSESSNVGD